MPEPGFAYALYYMASGEAQYGNRAIAWALNPAATDLRQIALVADWCRDLPKAPAVAAKLKTAALKLTADSVSKARDKTFAACALADLDLDLSARLIQDVVDSWWRKKTAPGLSEHPERIKRQDLGALFEMLHALRDNTSIDLRQDAVGYFKNLVQYQLLTYYPAPFKAPENEYRIPLMSRAEEPDLKLATLSRIAELSMVAYDNNAQESQFLQGWLINDNFNLKSTFGAPYEFLWANPYQPGLSFFYLPLFFHDPKTGQLFFRSSWNEDADWFGMAASDQSPRPMQLFRDGQIRVLKATDLNEPLRLGPIEIRRGELPLEVRLTDDSAATWFFLGLTPKSKLLVEIDDEEMTELETDAAGTLKLEVTPRPDTGVFLKPVS